MPKPFVWWDLEDLMPMLAMATLVGAQNLRLEYHPGEENSLVLVDRDTGEQCGDYNESHECPTDCPDEA